MGCDLNGVLDVIQYEHPIAGSWHKREVGGAQLWYLIVYEERRDAVDEVLAPM